MAEQQQQQPELPELPAKAEKLRRLRARGAYDDESAFRVLDEALVAHVAVVRGEGAEAYPVVLPMIFGRRGRALYLHGSVSAGLFRSAGTRVCVTATLVRGLVLARSIFHHSANYDSVVVFGRATVVDDEGERLEALRVISEHGSPGRWDACRAPNRNEMLQTRVLRVDVERVSVKSRAGPPGDDAADLEDPALAAVWTGVVPLRTVAGEPEPDASTDRAAAPPPDAVVARFS